MNWIRQKIEAKLYSGDVKRMVARNKIPDQRTSFERLKELGFSPELTFDIGAYHGDFSNMCLEIWPETTIYAFEALKDKIAPLKKRFTSDKVKVIEGIIGQEDKEAINFYADETASSVLASEEVNTEKKIVSQKMMRLDSFIKSENLKPPTLLKIDTQGYEFEILQGCGEILNSIEVILLELNFLEVYQNVKLAHEVIAFLGNHNFVIYDICEIHRRPLDMALFQIDFLFIKKDNSLREDKRWDKNILKK
jgi:FkbM family methyltransferase